MAMIGSSEESGNPDEVFDLELARSWITRRAFELVADNFIWKIPSWKIAQMEEWRYKMQRKTIRNSIQIVGDVAGEQLTSPIIIGRVDTGKEVEPEVAGGVPTGEEVEVEPVDDVEELRRRIAQITAGSIQIDADAVEEEEFGKVMRRIEEIKIDADVDEELGKVMSRIEEKDEAPTLSAYSDLICILQLQMEKLVEASYFTEEGKSTVTLWSDCERILCSIKELLSLPAQIDELCRLIPDLKEKLSLSSKYAESKSAAAENEEKQFAGHRHMWELFNGKKFEVLASFSSMIFTHCAPGRMPPYAVVKPTLQILSIKVTELTDLECPLMVYGIIAARDTVDNLRNPLFLCLRNGGQLVTEQDPFLHLTGPSRAVVCEEPVSFEE